MEKSTTSQGLSGFYRFYVSQHMNPFCRMLHFLGAVLVIFTAQLAFTTRSPLLLLLTPVWGYGLGWLGHLLFEKNRPATVHHPLFSLASFFIMFGHILTGRMEFSSTPPELLSDFQSGV